jgi:sterol 3beta-glucosyltransferase
MHSMNVLILTLGSRGDVQPFVALGRGLKAAGHNVTLSTASIFESFVKDNGLTYAHMDDGLIRLAETKAGRAAMEGGSKTALLKQAIPLIRATINDSWAAAQASNPNVIIYHPKALGGYHIAEKLGIPGILSLPLPAYTPTSAFPNPILMSRARFGGFFNTLTYRVMPLLSAPYAGAVNDWRTSVGLPRRSMFASELRRADGSPVPVLYSYSPHVVPTPPDFPPTTLASGYWFLDEGRGWTPPADLSAFLNAGDPPVYVGFGSMTGTNPEGKARMVLDALASTGQRGLLARGWGALKADALPPTVFMIDNAPHDWLFERVAAVVHHGGAGTTAAGLRAGKPTVIVPFMGDQFFWGERVAALGVGTQPIPQKALTADTLANAIRAAVSDAGIRQRAAELGAKIRAEDGIGNAISFIERQIQSVTASPV